MPIGNVYKSLQDITGKLILNKSVQAELHSCIGPDELIIEIDTRFNFIKRQTTNYLSSYIIV